MNNEGMIANQLGFESPEEMERYYDLCWATFKPEAIIEKRITKASAEEEIINNGMEDLLNSDREERLFEVARFKFDGLTECILAGDEQAEQYFRQQIDFLLSEAKKCISNKNSRKM